MSQGVAIDSAEFRRTLGHYPTGVAVVTAIEEDEPVGMAVGTFTSISLDPPLVGFFPASASRSWARIRKSGAFTVNVLGADQLDVCRAFATSGADKFAGVSWSEGPTGAPVLADAVAWVHCTLSSVHSIGDHDLAVGTVVQHELGSREARPLVFHRGGYGTCLDA
ncbi:flavin reductase family protein [Streptomyces sp. NPDC052052]|uniref:flavin reductase family protein n=1 Tax=Streptomyces sp. NPDC052052 TaxID=3154756 RepID=UPI00344A39DC